MQSKIQSLTSSLLEQERIDTPISISPNRISLVFGLIPSSVLVFGGYRRDIFEKVLLNLDIRNITVTHEPVSSYRLSHQMRICVSVFLVPLVSKRTIAGPSTFSSVLEGFIQIDSMNYFVDSTTIDQKLFKSAGKSDFGPLRSFLILEIFVGIFGIP